ncbi:MAG: SpoIID/LytB domain-containing protein [Calditrichaceae bacterium]|nr:SpoIID/LytB domain-containing protein [Calditrichaceae bacterium]
MLTPGIIPNKEPKIRVGIVLPEDEYTSVTAKTPADIDYQLEYSGKTLPMARACELLIKIEAGKLALHTPEKIFKANQDIKIYPILELQIPQPESGLLLKNIISGRSFHWKKNIDINLPGTVIVRIHESHLIVINELPLEQYIMCVATSEMSAKCPSELIKAQTIAARSWLLANIEQKHRDLEMDVCNDDCCQRYQGSTFLNDQSIRGARDTFGQILMSNEKICDARYSKNCGGVTEAFETIWPGVKHNYTVVKADSSDDPMEWNPPLSEDNNFKRWVKSNPIAYCSPWTVPENELNQYLGNVDEKGAYFRWDIRVKQQELLDHINQLHSIDAKAIVNLEILNRGGSGRANRLAVEYINTNEERQILLLQSEYSIRQSLYPKFLYSSAIIITPKMGKQNIPVSFQYHGAGWGHGVGLCQIGALGMALKGFEAEQILAHYYPGSVIEKIY